MANQPRQPQERKGQAGQKRSEQDQGRQAPPRHEQGGRDAQPAPRHGHGSSSEETPAERERQGERYPSEELSGDDDDL
jgi:hypothetical protein